MFCSDNRPLGHDMMRHDRRATCLGSRWFCIMHALLHFYDDTCLIADADESGSSGGAGGRCKQGH